MIRVYLIDDHRIFLDGLVKLLTDDPSIMVVGKTCNGREGVKRIQELKPDVVLMDVSMPLLNGLEGTRMISKVSPDTKVLILSMHDNEQFLRRALEAGAYGYLLKDTSADELLHAIYETHRGNCYLSPSLSKKLVHEYLSLRRKERIRTNLPELTIREREILQLLAEGHTNMETARHLGISQKTVQTHRKQIMKKLNFHRLTDLIRYAVEEGMTRP